MNLRLAPPRRNTRTSVRFDGVPCFHGSSKSASVFAMFRTRPVLFHLPDHPVLLCLLGDFHLPRVSELWLEKCRKLSPRHVCDCRLHARRVPFDVFLVLSSQFLQHDSQILLTIPWLRTHWLLDIGNHDCRSTQDRHTRLSSDLLKKPLCLLTPRVR